MTIPTRKEYKPLPDGTYMGASGLFLRVEGHKLTIGAPYADFIEVSLPPEVRLSRLEEVTPAPAEA